MIGCLVVLAAATVCGIARWRGKPPWLGTSRFLAAEAAVVTTAWLVMTYDWHASASASHRSPLDPQRPIVCLGDSLTSGIEPDPGYPEHLAQRLTVPVVNLGRAGISTKDGLKLLPNVAAATPQAVIIELGGHDFLKGHAREDTKKNLRAIIAAARRCGAEPILMEVPRGFMIDPYAGLERELAREEDIELISDTTIRRLVLWSPYAPPGMWTGGPYLSDDGLHPNAAGNDALAATVAHTLQGIFGDAIVRQVNTR
jgi:lysophospholipase L1-like esterase